MTARNPKTLMALPSEDSFDFLFKVVLIGDANTGKTCIVERFKTGNFIERHGNTIGVDFSMKTISLEGKLVKLQIWDTAGQERFRTITQSYYRSANGIIIVYDITSRNSFANIQKWIEEVRRYTTSDVMLIIVGNKSDLDNEREVEFEEAQQMCQYIPEVLFLLETSAKENRNIDDAFVALATELKKRIDTSITQVDTDEDAIKLGQSKPLNQCSSSCSLT
ncbi:ras-related protein Rab-43 [Stomoxys calcitrans]|uniref:Ras-related protein Rab-43 n=1 Tax=Stomoxys calcitrans TaxID=35570 RepID=A0A1I8PB27_STOCA|nr:ras-related protein Rab-43 [Stomoxys calcitrans]